MTIGMRNVKTALAVFLCIVISRLLNLEYTFYAAIAAIITMQSSVTNSFKAGRDRMLGTFVGALVGLLCALIMPGNAILCGIGIIIVIYICNLLHWNKSISIASIVFLAIMINLNGKNPFLYSANRLLDTLIGVSVSVLVNYFILPPDTLQKVSKKCYLLIDESLDLLKRKLLFNEEIDIERIHTDVDSLHTKLNICIDEYTPKKDTISKTQELQYILDLNKNIYSHLKTLEELNDTNNLNGTNIHLLNDLYSTSIQFKEYTQDDKDIVFNYHVGKLLEDLFALKSIENSNASSRK